MKYLKGLVMVIAGLVVGVAFTLNFTPTSQAADKAPVASWTKVADGASSGFQVYRAEMPNGDVCYASASGSLECAIKR